MKNISKSPGFVNLYYFKWHRAKLGYSLNPDSTKIIEKGAGSSSCHLLEEYPKLFMDFTKIKVNQIEEILNFCNQYGLLSIEDFDTRMRRFTAGINSVIDRNECESLEFWKQEQRIMKQIVQLWIWWTAKDIDKLKLAIHWRLNQKEAPDSILYILGDEETLKLLNGKRLYNQELGKHTTINGDVVPVISRYVDLSIISDTLALKNSENDILILAEYLIGTYITEKLNEYPTSLSFIFNNKTEKLQRYIKPINLLSAMWLEFYQAMYETTFQQCKWCGEWEDVTSKKNSWLYHKNCAIKAKVYKSRHSETIINLYKDNRTIKEISEIIRFSGFNTSLIDEWITQWIAEERLGLMARNLKEGE